MPKHLSSTRSATTIEVPVVKCGCPYSKVIGEIVTYDLKVKKEVAELKRSIREKEKKDKRVNGLLQELNVLINLLVKEKDTYENQVEVLRPLQDENIQLKKELVKLKNVQSEMCDRNKMLEDEKDKLTILCDALKFTVNDIYPLM